MSSTSTTRGTAGQVYAARIDALSPTTRRSLIEDQRRQREGRRNVRSDHLQDMASLLTDPVPFGRNTRLSLGSDRPISIAQEREIRDRRASIASTMSDSSNRPITPGIINLPYPLDDPSFHSPVTTPVNNRPRITMPRIDENAYEPGEIPLYPLPGVTLPRSTTPPVFPGSGHGSVRHGRDNAGDNGGFPNPSGGPPSQHPSDNPFDEDQGGPSGPPGGRGGGGGGGPPGGGPPDDDDGYEADPEGSPPRRSLRVDIGLEEVRDAFRDIASLLRNQETEQANRAERVSSRCKYAVVSTAIETNYICLSRACVLCARQVA